MQQLPQPWPLPEPERFAAIDGRFVESLEINGRSHPDFSFISTFIIRFFTALLLEFGDFSIMNFCFFYIF